MMMEFERQSAQLEMAQETMYALFLVSLRLSLTRARALCVYVCVRARPSPPLCVSLCLSMSCREEAIDSALGAESDEEEADAVRAPLCVRARARPCASQHRRIVSPSLSVCLTGGGRGVR